MVFPEWSDLAYLPAVKSTARVQCNPSNVSPPLRGRRKRAGEFNDCVVCVKCPKFEGVVAVTIRRGDARNRDRSAYREAGVNLERLF